eukprot:7498064-Prorocentrum_lima.AAC.1
MTSSLVGSEMCIRDSLSTTQLSSMQTVASHVNLIPFSSIPFHSIPFQSTPCQSISQSMNQSIP